MWQVGFIILSLGSYQLRKKYPQLLKIWKYKGYPAVPIISAISSIIILVIAFIPPYGGPIYLWFLIGYLAVSYIYWRVYASKHVKHFDVEEYIKSQEEALAHGK
jgi:amino acid transporter